MYQVLYNGNLLETFDNLGEAEGYIEVCKEDHPEYCANLYEIKEVKE